MEKADTHQAFLITAEERKRLLHAYETLVLGLDENINPDQQALMLAARDSVYTILRAEPRWDGQWECML